MDQELSRSERETLKAMYRLTKAGSDTHTGALAEALRVSPGTATAAVKRLAERDLAHHRPYRGVELTPSGRQAAVALDVQDGVIRTARLALGGVATRPWRAYAAEKLLVGEKPAEAAYEAAAREALKDARPHRHNAFKVELARRTVVRALTTVGGMP